ncbi:MAG: cytochrome c3 family protein, partial [Ignavibacteriaceae bacterium]
HKQNVSGPFNHEIRTGWALNRFHAKLSCTKCHGTSYKFTKLDNKCVSCHKDWKAGMFKHEITGLKLDKNHTDADCGDCHINKDFSKPPSCSNCHEDKSFPKDKPGILITGKR